MGVIAFLACLMIVIQAMVYFTDRETKWTGKDKQSTTAFYLAETAANRGWWKLKETSSSFSSVISSGAPAGYNNDVVYGDVPGGTYEVSIASVTASTISVIGTGKDSSKNEVRSVQFTFFQPPATSGSCPGLLLSGASLPAQFRIYWGPMSSVGNISLATANSQIYPRKYSKGTVSYTGTFYNTSGGTLPQGYNGACGGTQTDGLSWWACDAADTTALPTLDFATYKTMAGANYCNGGTCCTQAGVQMNPNTTAVYYFDTGCASVTFSGTTFINGTIISNASITLSSLSQSASGYVTVNPSPNFKPWLEYQKNVMMAGYTTSADSSACAGGGTNSTSPKADSACWDEYPGDGGLNTFTAYTIGKGRPPGYAAATLGGGTTAATAPLWFNGFLYMGPSTTYAAGSSSAHALHGLIMTASGVTFGSAATYFYYDPTVTPLTVGGSGCGSASSSGTGTFSQTSWKEINPLPF